MSSGQFCLRCFSCGKVINTFWDVYKKRTDNEESPIAVLDDLKIGRMCCRRMFMTHVDIEHFQLLYPTYKDNIQRTEQTFNKKPRNFGHESEDDDE